MVYRGCVLRNTDHIVGMVIYAGKKTKGIGLNTFFHLAIREAKVIT